MPPGSSSSASRGGGPSGGRGGGGIGSARGGDHGDGTRGGATGRGAQGKGRGGGGIGSARGGDHGDGTRGGATGRGAQGQGRGGGVGGGADNTGGGAYNAGGGENNAGGGDNRQGTTDNQEGEKKEKEYVPREVWDTWGTHGLNALNWATDAVKNWASPGRMAIEEGMAADRVASAYDNERQSFMRSLGRYGLNPNSGRFASALRSMALGRASGISGARNQTRMNILDQDVKNKMGLMGPMLNLKSAVEDRKLRDVMQQRQIDADKWIAAKTGKDNRASAGMSAIGQIVGAIGIGKFLSDSRCKRNIQQIGTLPGDLPLYEFTYYDDPDNYYIGVIAQELQRTKPHLVGTLDSGYLTVDYEQLIEEIQEAA